MQRRKGWKRSLQQLGDDLVGAATDALRDVVTDEMQQLRQQGGWRAGPIRTEVPPPPPPPKQKSPYEVLMVMENAPIEVCAAAHKALSKQYHPDNTRSADPAKAAEVNAAWARIKKHYGG